MQGDAQDQMISENGDSALGCWVWINRENFFKNLNHKNKQKCTTFTTENNKVTKICVDCNYIYQRQIVVNRLWPLIGAKPRTTLFF